MAGQSVGLRCPAVSRSHAGAVRPRSRSTERVAARSRSRRLRPLVRDLPLSTSVQRGRSRTTGASGLIERAGAGTQATTETGERHKTRTAARRNTGNDDLEGKRRQAASAKRQGQLSSLRTGPGAAVPDRRAVRDHARPTRPSDQAQLPNRTRPTRPLVQRRLDPERAARRRPAPLHLADRKRQPARPIALPHLAAPPRPRHPHRGRHRNPAPARPRAADGRVGVRTHTRAAITLPLGQPHPTCPTVSSSARSGSRLKSSSPSRAAPGSTQSSKSSASTTTPSGTSPPNASAQP